MYQLFSDKGDDLIMSRPTRSFHQCLLVVSDEYKILDPNTHISHREADYACSRSRSTSHGAFNGLYVTLMILALTISVSRPNSTALSLP